VIAATFDACVPAVIVPGIISYDRRRAIDGQDWRNKR